MCLQCFRRRQTYAIDPLQHFIMFVTLPVGATVLEKLEVFQQLGAFHMRPAAEVSKVPLRIHGNRCALFHPFNQINFVGIILELFQCFLSGNLMADNALVILGAFLHFLFNLRKIFVANDILAKIDVIVETFFYNRSDPELGLRIQVFDSLCHQMGTAVVERVQLFVFLEINHVVLPEYIKTPLHEGRRMRGTTLFPMSVYMSAYHSFNAGVTSPIAVKLAGGKYRSVH